MTTYLHVDYLNNSWMSVLSGCVDLLASCDVVDALIESIRTFLRSPPPTNTYYSSTVVVQVRVGRGRPSDNISSVEIWSGHADSRRYETIIYDISYRCFITHVQYFKTLLVGTK